MSDEAQDGFTPEERAAMKERAKEVKASRRRGPKKDPEADVLEKIAEMPDDDRAIAERLHGLIREAVPELTTKTWYGMPAYAKDGKVVCFFQSAAKFGASYATFGFDDIASIEDGDSWATSFAIRRLTPEVEEHILSLVRRSAS